MKRLGVLVAGVVVAALSFRSAANANPEQAYGVHSDERHSG
jgi:hypothetical protein